jgi:glycosyltransferase involved in cell wall biosynthesis
MRIGVNTVSLRPGYRVETLYFRNVLAKMRVLQGEARFVLFTDPANHDMFHGWERFCVGKPGLSAHGGAQTCKSLDQAIQQAGVDALFTPLRTAPRSRVPTVLSVLNIERTPAERRGIFERQGGHFRRTCAAATAIVAPSDFVKKRLLEDYEVPMDKVVVAPLGVDPLFSEPQSCLVQKPYLLTVAAELPPESISRLLDAFARLRRETAHVLVMVGGAEDGEAATRPAHVLQIDQCASNHLASLYQHCDLYINAAVEEGSAATVLEAMGAGARVLTGRTGAAAEVAGTAPIYYNPESPKDLVVALRRGLAESPTDREKHINLGRHMAAEYTWEKSAWKTLSAFRRI